ncbi:hypothetical protein [Massilia sp. PWRC2]|uniref:hypothetical protein n=1 Tax=Massilia sp. PWRC2 TaxID=2804626 RepID=UPI003CE7BAE6
MVSVVRHRKVNIVQLDADEAIACHCQPGDIALVAGSTGWSLHFLTADGAVESYETPYASQKEALWAAKAAAEFGFS